MGPTAVQSQNFGLVTGRVSSLALDPADAGGNRLLLGTTGGGVWKAENAGTSNPAHIVFTPLTDDLAALGGVLDPSISIGAVTVQPGGTGVILAGTGDPNDALDSYYGAGILRSTDGGSTWSLISLTADLRRSFAGEGFAGFAWSSVNPELVVAAVSQAYEGTLVNAVWPNASCQGLYYSIDSGATWTLARITDGGSDVQGPNDATAQPDGNAATSVVWNPVRQLFVAAVRYHGYYQSADGATWTRMDAQPGAGLTARLCPTNPGSTGSPACPIFRGALAVNPQTGDTFAWTVDGYDQDQGLWQDQCQASAGACATAAISFARQWSTAALETSTLLGPATIANGDYNLVLAAVPSQQDTLLMAGANDLWRCSLAMGCPWRNTTNSTAGFCAQVGEYQHALAWNPANPMEVFVGNDSGLWRSTDAIAETGPVCSATDAGHFQNLNGSMGSLAEVESISQTGLTPYTVMAGLGANGTAGVKAGGTVAEWPEILGGEGGPVAIDPVKNSNWYANNQAGVSIHLCAQQSGCTPSAFGSSPVVGDADVGGDGLTMTVPAPFLVDPLDNSQLLIGTCRVWRGPASGGGWTGANAISPILDGSAGSCNGDALIRSMAAMALPSNQEVIYVGTYGAANGGARLPGHLLSATFSPTGRGAPAWQDLSLNPVGNDTDGFNAYGLDISSIAIDSHDPTGKTVYASVAGVPTVAEPVRLVYGSTDGGAHWTSLMSNLPATPANSVVVDPGDASTVYLGADAGVFATRQIANCSSATPGCWARLGSNLPEAPVVQLSASPISANMHELVAATYGRGIWTVPLLSANPTTATVSPTSLVFPAQAEGTVSSRQTVTVTNTGTQALTPASIAIGGADSGDFSITEDGTGNCKEGAAVAAGSSCTIPVAFAPQGLGSRTATLVLTGNLSGANPAVSLQGSGAPRDTVSLSTASLNFDAGPLLPPGWVVGVPSSPLPVTINNAGVSPLPFTFQVTGPFSAVNQCPGSAAPAEGSCPLSVTFTPTQPGVASGTLTLTDEASNSPQAVALSGNGLAKATDDLSAKTLDFPDTATGQVSFARTVTVKNNGQVNLTSLCVSIPIGQPFVVAASQAATTRCGNNPLLRYYLCGGSQTLAPGGSCAISVQFSPTVTGKQSGTLSVSDLMRTQTVALTGTGVRPPALGVKPSSLSFPGEPVGQSSPPATVTVTNTGELPLADVGFAIGPASGSGFQCSPRACAATTCPLLSPGGSCSVGVVFTPVAAGGGAATLWVSSSTSGVSAVPVLLNGTGLAVAGLNVNPTQLTFPIVLPGQVSAPLAVTISNSGQGAATSLTIAATAPFGVVQNTCGATLAAGAKCTAGVAFSPQLDGPYAGTLAVDAATMPVPATVLLSGQGGVPGSVQFQPIQLAFAQTGVGQASDATTVTVTNPDGVNSLQAVALAVSQGFTMKSNTCPSTLPALASCTVALKFSPASAGVQSGSLTVTDSALPQGSFLGLSGMGFDFAIAPMGLASQPVTSGQTAFYKLSIATLNGSQGVIALACPAQELLPPYTTCTFNPSNLIAVNANAPANPSLQIATGVTQTVARAARPPAWPALPLACGLALLPFALRRGRRALLLAVLLAILAGGVTSCTESGGIIGGVTPPKSGVGITPAGAYTVTVTALSNGVLHSVPLKLNVD